MADSQEVHLILCLAGIFCLNLGFCAVSLYGVFKKILRVTLHMAPIF